MLLYFYDKKDLSINIEYLFLSYLLKYLPHNKIIPQKNNNLNLYYITMLSKKYTHYN